MIGINFTDFFVMILILLFAYLAWLWLRENQRIRRNERQLNSRRLFFCRKDGFFFAKHPVSVCRCPKCNRYCILQRSAVVDLTMKHQNKTKIIPLIIMALGITLSGCVPWGTPPEGHIIGNDPRDARQISTPAEAMDYLISSLTVALLNNCPGEAVQLAGDRKSAALNRRVLYESGKISGNRATLGNSIWVLKSSWVEDKIAIQLLKSGECVWSENLQCTFDPAQLQ